MSERQSSCFRDCFFSFLIPNLISSVFAIIDTSVTSMLASRRLGDAVLSSLNAAVPVYLFLCALGSLLGSGAFYLAARAYGRADTKEGGRIISASVWLAAAVSAVIMLLGLALSPLIASLLAPQGLQDMVLTYVRVVFAGSVPVIMAYMPFNFLRLVGKVRYSALAVVIMGSMNVLGVLVFVYLLDLGIAGSALSLVVSSASVLISGFCFLMCGERGVKIRLIRPQFSLSREVFRFGSPSALNNLFLSLRIVMVNMLIPDPMLVIAAMINSISDFAWCMPNSGVMNTASPLLGVLEGERDAKEARGILHLAAKTALLICLAVTAALFVLAPFVSALFNVEADSSFAIRCLASSLIFSSLSTLAASYFNAGGRILRSNLVIALRLLILPVASIIVLNALGLSVWLFLPVSEILTALIAALLMRLTGQNEAEGQVLKKEIRAVEDEICEASASVSAWAEEENAPVKTAMTIGLGIEEIMMVMKDHSLTADDTISIRLAMYSDVIILTLRTGGRYFNPLAVLDDSDEYMGIRMIERMASEVSYQDTLGLNTFILKMRR